MPIVKGNFSIQSNSIIRSARSGNKKIVTSSTNLTIVDRIVFVRCSDSDITLYLPDARQYEHDALLIKKIDNTTFKVKIKPIYAQKIDDQDEYELNDPQESVYLVTDGNNWYTIAHDRELFDIDVIDGGTW